MATSGVIFASSGYTWAKYYFHAFGGKFKKLDGRVMDFTKYTLIGFACIGLHQFFEFLSIWSNDQSVYKVGLLISISFPYFLMLALEKLTRKHFGSWGFLAVIAGLGVYMFSRDMYFENAHFYVRGFSHIVWSFTWMMLFLYWNLCVVLVAFQLRTQTNRRLLLVYPWVFANFTFVAMLGYVFLAHAANSSVTVNGLLSCTGLTGALADYQGGYDIASIWCVLAALSIFFIPSFYTRFQNGFMPAELSRVKKIEPVVAAGFVVLSAALLYFLYVLLPVIAYVGLKSVTR